MITHLVRWMLPSDEKRRDKNSGVVLSFDFVVDKLRCFYSNTSPQAAYREIKMFLIENGYIHLKDSDYVNMITNLVDAYSLMKDFAKDNKWFTPSLKKFNLSPYVPSLDISPELKVLFDDIDWIKEREREYYGLEETVEQTEEYDLEM